MQYCLSNCNTAISSRHEHRLTKSSMRHSRTPLSSSNKSKQHPSERHHTAATFVQASRSIQETFLLRGNPSSNLMQHCSLSGNIRHLNQLRYRAPTNIQTISVHVTFCPGKLSQQHHIHPSDRHPGDINPCNIFIQAALERGSAHDGSFGLVEKLTFPTPILHHTNPMQPSAYCEQRACRTIHRIA